MSGSGWDAIVEEALSDLNDSSSVVNDGKRRQADRHLSPKQRKRRQADRLRYKLTLDVPPWIKGYMQRVSEREGLSLGSVGAFLLIEGLKAYKHGAEPDKESIRHPRFEYTLAETSPESEGL